MDTRQIKTLMKDFDESSLSKLKIQKDGFSIEMEKATAVTTVAPASAPVSAPVTAVTNVASAPATETTSASSHSGDYILSPMVGTFYEAPSPDSPPFVKVGDIVKKGQTLAILEAMKIMNELEADFDCKIVDILVKNGQAVEYDMPLFAVERV
jgi:acetyl-CoA carboxylase biotin carboxyl carrier protein